jgi:hypothetical protein
VFHRVALGVWLGALACARPHEVQPTIVVQPVTTCSAMTDRIDRAACVVDRGVRRAYEQKDVVKLVCIRDKAARIDALKSGPRDAAAENRAIELQIESSRCIGAGPEMFEGR